MIESIKEVVGEIEYYKRNTHPNTIEVKFPKILSYILCSLGIPPGRKVFTNPSIPEFILNNPKLYKVIKPKVFSGTYRGGFKGKELKLIL